jgi:hypothetical protein
MNNEDTNDERKKEVAQQLLDIDLEVAREQVARLHLVIDWHDTRLNTMSFHKPLSCCIAHFVLAR